MKTKFPKLLNALILSLFLITNYGCEKKEMSDEQFYNIAADNLMDCCDDIFVQNIVGQPTGSVNKTVNGPLGGTVIITGTGSYSESTGVTTLDFIFEMQDVPYAEVTFNGSISFKGTYSSSYKNWSHFSDNFSIIGLIDNGKIERPINKTGAVSIHRTLDQTSGSIFGYAVSW